MGTTYFEANPQKVRQWGSPRRNEAKPSGVVVIHTAESTTDFSGPDIGAESVASYMLRRSNYASYHAICDFDSTLQLAPWWGETWHDTGTNNHSVGISAAIQCKHWDELGARGDAIVRRMAIAASNYAKWLKKYYGITIPARKITRTQSRNMVPGFLAHGTSDPGRRTDPGPEFNWTLFLKEYSRLMEIKVTPVKVEPPVASNKPKPRKVWPFVDLAEDGDFGSVTIAALQELLKGIDLYSGKIDGKFLELTKKGLQSLLKAWGDYDGRIDGKFFGMSKEALQVGLKSRGFYSGKIDRDWGDMTTTALQKYINSQAEYYD